MKIAVIGSRSITTVDLAAFLPADVTEIISGGAKGVDTCAAAYAESHGIPLTVIKPEYEKYKRGAPLKRNETIVDRADAVLAFWDGTSHGTKYVIDYCRKTDTPVTVITP